MSFLFLPSSLICTLHVSYSRLEETRIFFSRIRSEKGEKKINRHSPLVRYDLLVTFEPFYLSAGIVQLADQRQRFFFNELLRFQHLHEFVRVFCAEETNKFSLFLFRLENFNWEEFLLLFTIETHLLLLEPFQFCPSVCWSYKYIRRYLRGWHSLWSNDKRRSYPSICCTYRHPERYRYRYRYCGFLSSNFFRIVPRVSFSLCTTWLELDSNWRYIPCKPRASCSRWSFWRAVWWTCKLDPVLSTHDSDVVIVEMTRSNR